MPQKCSVFVAMSLDGYIARAEGQLDWLDAANAAVPEGEDCGFNNFMDSVDVLIMGRKTYEKVLSIGKWPYGNKPTVVLSSSKIDIPGQQAQTVSSSSESPKELCKRLVKDGARRFYIDGPNTIQRFLAEEQIDELIITVIPVLIGKGISLFGDLKQDITLKHKNTKTYDFGFVTLTYEIVK